MADISPDDYSRLMVENYCIVASSALIWFDFTLTFTSEVRTIWGRRFSGATVIYLLLRYVAVIERIFFVMEPLIWQSTDRTCSAIIQTDNILLFLNYLAFSAFTVLRIYALWDRSWMTLLLVTPIALVKPALSLYEDTVWIGAQGGPPWGCYAIWTNVTNDQLAQSGILMTLPDSTIAKATTIACDALLIAFTWIKTYGIHRTSAKLGFRTSLSKVLLRDGTAYFIVLLVIQIVTIVTSYIGSELTVWLVWPYFDQAITVIFLSRIMLNLRGLYYADPLRAPGAVDSVGGGPGAWWDSENIVSDIRFAASRASARVVGNLGAPLGTDADSALFTSAYGCEGECECGVNHAHAQSDVDAMSSAGALTSVSPIARRRVPRLRVVGADEEADEGVQEVLRDEEIDGSREWWEDEKEAFVLHPFSAGLLGPTLSLSQAGIPSAAEAHAGRVDGDEMRLGSPITPVSPASPDTPAAV